MLVQRVCQAIVEGISQETQPGEGCDWSKNIKNKCSGCSNAPESLVNQKLFIKCSER